MDDLQRRVLFHLGDVGRPRIAVDVALARLQLGVARRRVGRDGEDEIVDQRLLAEIMIRVLLEADHRILLIGDEIERAGADRRLVELLRRALLQQEVGVFGRADRHEVHREIGEDGDVRLLQLDDDGVVVGLGHRVERRRHVHVVEVVVLAARHLEVGVVFLPLTVDREQHVVGVEIAGRREILDAVELDALAQMEGDRLAAVGDVPALGQTGNDLGGAALEFGQAVVDRPRRVEAGAGGVDRRGEVLRAAFRAIDQGLGRGGGHAGQQGRQPEAGEDDRFHRSSPRTTPPGPRDPRGPPEATGRHLGPFSAMTQWAEASRGGLPRRSAARAGRSARAPRVRR